MTDEDIDYSDMPPLDDEWFRDALIRLPNGKKLVSIRVDEDVLAWFKSRGKGYQTKMNAVLKAYMQAHAARDPGPVQKRETRPPRRSRTLAPRTSASGKRGSAKTAR